jgi:antibiotic biosynthesis monooxygenase (ABM) superfamily enzyme
MKKQKAVFIVWASIAPGKEEAFNRWYNEEHLPKTLEWMPGILSGRRYKIIEGDDTFKYMALYEFESYEAMEAAVTSEQGKRLTNEYNTAWGEGGRKRLRCTEIKNLIVG